MMVIKHLNLLIYYLDAGPRDGARMLNLANEESLNGDGFSEVPGLIDIVTQNISHMI